MWNEFQDKIQVRSIIDYALPVYWHTLRVAEKNRFEQLQYKSAKIVTGALHLTSKDKLNLELGWESIETRANILGITLFHKTLLGNQRPLISSCMPIIAPSTGHNTRNQRRFLSFPRGKVKFSNSYFVLFTRKYEQIPKDITKLRDMTEFKTALKKHFAPQKCKFFAHGSKLGNKYLTQIRVGRSYLNDHSFQIQMTPSPQCSCHAARESPLHFFLDCKNHSEECRTMICSRQMSHFNTLFKIVS